ncbi:MAG: c-type cytochrome [Planctomycetaceae bacterium]|jgi:putative heme-binding domain-containing protein|nr:c-type cytochrome [Planctomycetaceae bacterium]
MTHCKITVYPCSALVAVCLAFLVVSPNVASQDSPSKDKLIVETLLRLKRYDVSANDKWKAAIGRHLETIEGTPRYLELVKTFGIREAIPELLELTISLPTDTMGVNAASMLLDFKQSVLLKKVIHGEDNARALAVAQALSLGGHPARSDILRALIIDAQLSRQIRNIAIKGVGTTKQGQRYLIDLLTTGRIAEELMFGTGTALFASSDPDIVKSAKELVTLPTTANATPLPPVSELIRIPGDPVAGKVIFANKGNCIKCHKVGGVGKEIGPSLSEIGSKLSKEAMFVSILDPSAGISHNYETYAIVLDSGNILSGILVSRSDEEVVVRNADGIDRVIAVTEIEEIKKTGISLMPADLQKVMTIEELVSVVAYLAELKKPQRGNNR